MKHRFCGVLFVKRNLYVVTEAKTNGPRCIVMPPKLLESTIDDSELGSEIESALMSFQSLGRSICADEWDDRNHVLLTFFDEKSVSSFERKKRDVTVRLETETREVQLFGPKNQNVVLPAESGWEEVAKAVKQLLKLES